MTDERLLALTLYYEAGNQPTMCKVAVAQVILSRRDDRRWPDTIHGVILQPMQFSCWNGRDHEKAIVPGNESFALCEQIAHDCLTGAMHANGYNHYYNPKLCHPSWAASLRDTVQIGDHIFGKA